MIKLLLSNADQVFRIKTAIFTFTRLILFNFAYFVSEESDSTFEWVVPEGQEQSFLINGYELHLKADVYGTVKCQLRGDTELGSLALELEANSELIERVLSDQNQEQEKVNLDIQGNSNAEADGIVNLACTPGENC